MVFSKYSDMDGEETMRQNSIQNQTKGRLPREREGFAAPNNNMRWMSRAYVGRLLSLLLILSLLLNTFSFTMDDIAFADDVPTGMPHEDEAPINVDEQVLELDDVDLDDLTDEHEATNEDAGHTYTHDIGYEDAFMLSDIVKKLELPIRKMKDIEMVSVLGSLADANQPPEDATEALFVEPVMNEEDEDEVEDYSITALRFFKDAGLVIYTKDDMYTIRLTRPEDAEKVMEEMAKEKAREEARLAAEAEQDLPDEPEETEVGNESGNEGEAATFAYEIGEGWPVPLSDVMATVGMPLEPTEVDSVYALGVSDGGSEAVSIEPIDGDYLISVLRDFDEAGLSVYAGEAHYTILLKNGRVHAQPVEPEPEPVEEPTPEQTIEETTPDQNEEDTTPEQSVEGQTPEQTVEDTTPEQPVEETTPEQTVEDNTPEQPVEETTPEQTVEDTTPEQPIEETTPEQTVEDTTPEQPVEEIIPEQTVEDTTPEQPVEEQTPDQTVEDTTPEQTVEDITPEQPVEEATPEQTVEDQTPEQGIEETTPEQPVKENIPEQNIDEVTTEQPEPIEDQTPEEPTPEEPVVESAPVLTYPAQTFTGRTSRVRVTVTAGEGAFPEGTTMKLLPVLNRDTLSEFADTVADDFLEVKQVLAVDIAFYDANGIEIEPLIPITVVMTIDEIEDEQEALIVHMDDEGTTEIVEQSEAPQSVGNKLALNVEMPASEEEAGEAAIETTDANTQNDETDDTGLDIETIPTKVDAEPTDVENGENLTFEADSFSMYAILITQVIETRYVDANGDTYQIEVGYGEESGIPADVELVVSEIQEGSAEYDDYMAMSAETLEQDPEFLDMLRAFDITLRNPETGEVYQPKTDVQVTIRLLDAAFDEYADVSVVHFGDETEVIESNINGETVEFETDGFSVYALIGTCLTKTFYFQTMDETGYYTSYFFATDQADSLTTSQTIRSGDKLFAPNSPSHPDDSDEEFIGWYEGNLNGPDADKVANGERFDFDAPVVFSDSQTEAVYLHAVFKKVATIRFHGQANAAGAYPIVATRQVILTSDNGGWSWTGSVEDIEATYYNEAGNNAFPGQRFVGWSADDEPTSLIDSQNYTVTILPNQSSEIDLYARFVPIYWLRFISGEAGSSATYFSPVSYADDEWPDTFTGYIPTRPGYTFTGWYLDKEATQYKIVEPDGTINLSAGGTGISIKEGKLKLTESLVTLYAGWAAADVKYQIVVWKQRTPNENDYIYAETFDLLAKPYSSTNKRLKIKSDDGDAQDAYEYAINGGCYYQLCDLDAYNTVHTTVVESPYSGFVFNESKSDTGAQEIDFKGTTVFNLYYNYQSETQVPSSTENYSITFAYPKKLPDETPITGMTDYTVNYTTGDDITGITPPTCPDALNVEGYDFYWYADSGWTTRVFFNQAEYDSCSDAKILYQNMPAQDLKVYGGWKIRRFLIQIDPNHGSLNQVDGNGEPIEGNSTYFKLDYGEAIGEYKDVTRNYVPSESGQYYYVYHDRAYGQTHANSDRYAYYTTDITRATEMTTYAEDNDIYLCAGWYEQLSDGTEQLYDFEHQSVDHDITLKLHWKLSGEYYVEYNADVTQDGKRLVGTLGNGGTSLTDPNAYNDQAAVTPATMELSPEGYEFVGWRVRGDESGKLYYPGATFALPAEFAVTMNGKKKVFMDAVYGQSARGRIVYDANGGTIVGTVEAVDFGQPTDEGDTTYTPVKSISEDRTTATLSNLTPNSGITLSNGTGFQMKDGEEDAELTGWYTVRDGLTTHFDLGQSASLYNTDEKYYVDADSSPLYAEWKVNVKFQLPEGARWAGNWDGFTPVPEDAENPDAYTRKVYLHSILEAPTGSVIDADGVSYDYWSTSEDADAVPFEFGKTAIEASDLPLTLYAHKAGEIAFHVVQNDGTLKDDWRKTGMTALKVTGQPIDLTTDADLLDYVEAGDGYAYSYACLSADANAIDPSNAITAVKIDESVVKVTSNGTDYSVIPDGQYIYLVYAPAVSSIPVKVVYVEETAGGELQMIQGCSADSEPAVLIDGTITYNQQQIILNGTAAARQNEEITVTTDLTTISQEQANAFKMLPQLDKGMDVRSLVYFKIGVGNANNTLVSQLGSGVSEGLQLYLQIRDNQLKWSFDNATWMPVEGAEPTIYAIYREVGYNLEISKSVFDGAARGISPDKTFTVTIESEAITATSYKVEGTGDTKVSAAPVSVVNGQTVPGKIELTKVKDGSDIKIIGLPKSTSEKSVYTITESRSGGFILTTKVDNAEVGVSLDNSIQVDLRDNTVVRLTNTPQEICRIREGSTIHSFYTLNKALEFVEANMDGSATIEMLYDYAMPSWDSINLTGLYNITLTSWNPSSPQTITRDLDFTSGPMILNEGVLTLKDIILDGNADVNTASAMIQNNSTLVIDSGTTIQNANGTGRGGAVYMQGGTLTVQNTDAAKNPTFKGNKAANGGAIYASAGSVMVTSGNFTDNSASTYGGAIYYSGTGTVEISDGKISGNQAVNGGAIYAISGTIKVNGTAEFEGNNTRIKNGAEQGDGGAVYMTQAVLELGGSAQFNQNTAQNGGAIYSESGSITMASRTGVILSENEATVGNGGAIYIGTGSLAINSGNYTSLTKNKAENGNGGAIYVDSGSVEMACGTIGDENNTDNANEAKNGAGIYVNSGSCSFVNDSTAIITGNVASDGGAIGVGSANARLYFRGGVQVRYNMPKDATERTTLLPDQTVEHNVYLDKDSDAIINTASLKSNAYIGVYVTGTPGSNDATDMFAKHGTITARFGTYADATNIENIHNDRLSGKASGDAANPVIRTVSVAGDSTTFKLYWSRPIVVRALICTGDNRPYRNGFPPFGEDKLPTDAKLKPTASFMPSGNNNKISIISEDFVKANAIDLKSTLYAGAFLNGATAYNELVSEINWSDADQTWEAVRSHVRGNAVKMPYSSDAGAAWLDIYYTYYAYLQIENNSDYTLKEIQLFIQFDNYPDEYSNTDGYNVVAGDYSYGPGYGYGYVVSDKNGTREALEPIVSTDMTIEPHQALKLMLPGACERPYVFKGTFVDSQDQPNTSNINYKADTNSGTVTSSVALPTAGKTWKLKKDNGKTYSIIFGGNKSICKIVTNNEVTGDHATAGTDYVDLYKYPSDGNPTQYEYCFSTLNQAVNFAKNNVSQLPTVSGKTTFAIEMLTDYIIPSGDNVSIPEALANCDITFKTAVDGAKVYTGTDQGENSYFNIAASTDTSKYRATISRDAGNNNPLITSTVPATYTPEMYNQKLTIEHLKFDGRNLGGTSERGVIYTLNCNEVTIDNVEFKNCAAKTGGGLFIDFNEQYPASNAAKLEVKGQSVFVGCESTTGTRRGGGAIWTVAKEMVIDECQFLNCIAEGNQSQGGAVFHRMEALKPGGQAQSYKEIINYARQSKTRITKCTFSGCESTAAGAIETEAFDVSIEYCKFLACKATSSKNTVRNAGAVNIYIFEGLTNADDAVIDDADTDSGTTEVRIKGCLFENCSTAGKMGGGIRSTSQILEVSDCSFYNCTAVQQGGAIAHTNSEAYITGIYGCTMENCSGSIGGGVYSKALELTVGDYTIPASEANARTAIANNLNAKPLMDEENSNIRHTWIENCVANASKLGNGGAIAHVKNGEDTQLPKPKVVGNESTPIEVKNKTSITNAKINDNLAKSGNGGGVYTSARKAELEGCTIANNTAQKDGGGVSHKYADSNDKAIADSTHTWSLTVDSSTIKGNTSGTKGGGICAYYMLTLRDDTKVQQNRLSTGDGTETNAAGVYMVDGKTLTVGRTRTPQEKADATSVENNMTASNQPSNLRLSYDNTNKKNSDDSVFVNCALSGTISVINAASKGKKFGVSVEKDFQGFSDTGFKEEEHTFVADDGSLFGVFDRIDDDESDNYDIIWRGDMVCKLTNANNQLLYMDSQCHQPAIFDRLDYAKNPEDYDNKSTPGSSVSPFSYLRTANPELYTKGSDGEGVPFNVNTDTVYVKLLVENIKLDTQTASYTRNAKAYNNANLSFPANTKVGIVTGIYPGRTIVLTTANRSDSFYPYTGRAGTYATISRADTVKNTTIGPMIIADTNLTFQNITIDGRDTQVNGSNLNGALIYAVNPDGKNGPGSTTTNITVTLGANATLKNGNTGNDGGGVFVNSGYHLNIAGGSIVNCKAKNGGGVFKGNTNSELHFSSGTISGCTATGNGGGLYIEKTDNNPGKTTVTMSGNSRITGCSSNNNGGGVFLNQTYRFFMRGGSIDNNTAKNAGGGIYLMNNSNTRVFFSGRVMVTGNKLSNGTPCNVELCTNNKNDIIQIEDYDNHGIERGSYIGVYTAGQESDKNSVYYNRGIAEMTFGTINGNRDQNLYYFVNDRNGLKGVKEGSNKVKWAAVYSLEIGKTVRSDDPDDFSREFEFTLRLKQEDGSVPTAIKGLKSEAWDDTDIDLPTIDNNGTVTFKLKSGESRAWYNLPANLKYTVTETAVDDFTSMPTYEESGTTKIGHKDKSIVMDPNAPIAERYHTKAEFTNTRAVCMVTVNVNGTRYLLYEEDRLEGVKQMVYSSLYKAFQRIRSDGKYLYNVTAENPEGTSVPNSVDTFTIEMLVPDYAMTSAATLNANTRKITLTKAGDALEGYSFIGDSSDVTISRSGFRDQSMLIVRGDLTVKDITLDGQRLNQTTSANGSIARVDGGTLTLDDATLQNGKTSKSGGAVYVNGGTLTIKQGSSIQDSEATQNGGAVYVNAGTVTIKGSVTGNTAANGGAVYVNAGTVTVEGGVTNNTATNGGAAYVNGGTLQIVQGGGLTGNTADQNGGATYVATGASMEMSAGTISGNSAALGGAIFADNGEDSAHATSVTISGGSITTNSATGNNGGAVNVGGENVRLNFSGTPTVYNNPSSDTQRNVVLSVNSNAIINTTGNGLGEGAQIGVYAIESQKNEHGISSKPFGTYASGATGNLSGFINDLDTSLTGCLREGSPYIHWSPIVCKLTNESGQLLYYKDGDELKPAVYGSLQGGFEATKTPRLYVNANEYYYIDYDRTASNNPPIRVEMLCSDALNAQVTCNVKRNVVLTTAKGQGQTVDEYYYQDSGSYATISRGNIAASNSMIVVNSGYELKLENIILDGNKSNKTTTANGGIVKVTSGSLTVGQNTTLQNAKTSANGGAVYVAAGASMSMSTYNNIIAGRITGCEAANGSAVFLENGSAQTRTSFTMNYGTITGNSVTGTAGGAIGVGGAYTTLTFSSAPTVSGNTMSDGTTPSNVYLSENAVDVINCNGLYGGTIGVYAADTSAGEQTVYDLRGVAGTRFGTSLNNGDQAMYFVNDRDETLKGLRLADGSVVWPARLRIVSFNYLSYELDDDYKARITLPTSNQHPYDEITLEGNSNIAPNYQSDIQPGKVAFLDYPYADVLGLSNDQRIWYGAHPYGFAALEDDAAKSVLNSVYYDYGTNSWKAEKTVLTDSGESITNVTIGLNDALELYFYGYEAMPVTYYEMTGADAFSCVDSTLNDPAEFKPETVEAFTAEKVKDLMTYSPLSELLIDNNVFGYGLRRFNQDWTAAYALGPGPNTLPTDAAEKALVISSLYTNAIKRYDSTIDFRIAKRYDGYYYGDSQANINTRAGNDVQMYVFLIPASLPVTITKTWSDATITDATGDRAGDNTSIQVKLFDKDNALIDMTGVAQTDATHVVVPAADATDKNTVTLKKPDNTHVSTANGVTTWTWYVNLPVEAVYVQEELIMGYIAPTEDIKIVNMAANISNAHAVCKITYAQGETRMFHNAYATLQEAFDDVNNAAATDVLASAEDIRIEMLVPAYTMTTAVTLRSGRSVTLTTASETTLTGTGDELYPGPYTGDASTICAISGGALTASMIETAGDLTLKTITLDGNKADRSVSGNGGIVKVNNGSLNVDEDATLQNAETTGKGGAVYVNGGAMTLSAGTIKLCGAQYGGGVYVNDGTLSMTGGAIEDCVATENGGAIFNASAVTSVTNGSETQTVDTVTISGGTIDGHNTLTAATDNAKNGGGIYMNAGSLKVSAGAKVQNMVATANGGGIYMATGALNIANGSASLSGATNTTSITNCKATNGGGVYLTAPAAQSAADSSALITGAANSVTATGANMSMVKGAISNCEATGNGGGVYIDAKATMDITGGSIIGNYSSATTGKGGGIYLAAGTPSAAGGTLTMTGGTIGGTTASSANSAANGGAVYVDAYAVMTLQNGSGTSATTPTITGNGSLTVGGTTYNTQNGAGIYLAENGKLNLSGSPNFGGADVVTDEGETEGNILGESGNFIGTTLTGAKNGQKAYEKPRQDIFIAGYLGKDGDTPKAATSIVVTGDLTGDPGTIWVAAENPTPYNADNHYEMLKQFATIQTGVTLSQAGYKVFRNAMTDLETGCGADYLSGQTGVDIGEYKCIYWTGGFDFAFRKIDSNGVELPGAKFALYSDASCQTPISRNSVNMTAVSDANGIVTFPKLAPNKTGEYYYMVEYHSPVKAGTTNGNTVTLTDMMIYRVQFDAQGKATVWTTNQKATVTTTTTTEGGVTSEAVSVSAAADTSITPAEAPKFTIDYEKNADGSYKMESGQKVPIYQYVVMNETGGSRRVILRKASKSTSGDEYTSLSGAHFKIYRADMSEVTEGQPVGNTYYVSDASGVYFSGELPFGTYYLLETLAPTSPDGFGANAGKVFTLTVSATDTSVVPFTAKQVPTTATTEAARAAKFVELMTDKTTTTGGGGGN